MGGGGSAEIVSGLSGSCPLQFLPVVLKSVLSKRCNPSLSLLVCLVYSSILEWRTLLLLIPEVTKQREHCTTLALCIDHHDPKPGLYALIQ